LRRTAHVREHADGPNHALVDKPDNGVAVADLATARHPERRMRHLKGAIDEIANSLQTVTLLSTQLRRDLGESAQRAIEVEAAADKAVRALKRLQPKKPR
jgi:hypothetical protein